jgi:hypothetical protein
MTLVYFTSLVPGVNPNFRSLVQTLSAASRRINPILS